MIQIQWNPSRTFLQQFSAIFVVFFVSFAAYYGLWENNARTGLILLAVSLLGLIGLAVPGLMRYVYVTWMVLVFPIGWIVSMLLLVSIYYLVVFPIGLIMKWCGHDRCPRHFDPDTTTYWKPRTATTDPGRYFRQF